MRKIFYTDDPIRPRLELLSAERSFDTGFVVREYGFINKTKVDIDRINPDFEVAIRMSSDDEYAVDELDGKKYRTPYPHVILKLPGMHHRYRIRQPRQGFFFIMPPKMAEILKRRGYDLTPPIWTIRLTREINSVICDLLEAAPEIGAPLMRERVELLFARLFLELYAARRDETKNHYGIDEKIRQINIYLQANDMRNVNIGREIAKNGIPSSTFYRRWKELYGRSPETIHYERLMLRAMKMLNDTSAGIAEIAEKLGFEDVSYFSRCFRKQFGKSPSACRKEKNPQSGEKHLIL